MSFIVGLSNTCLDRPAGFQETKNSKRFILFIKGVIKRNEQSGRLNNWRI